MKGDHNDVRELEKWEHLETQWHYHIYCSVIFGCSFVPSHSHILLDQITDDCLLVSTFLYPLHYSAFCLLTLLTALIMCRPHPAGLGINSTFISTFSFSPIEKSRSISCRFIILENAHILKSDPVCAGNLSRTSRARFLGLNEHFSTAGSPERCSLSHPGLPLWLTQSLIVVHAASDMWI